MTEKFGLDEDVGDANDEDIDDDDDDDDDDKDKKGIDSRTGGGVIGGQLG